MRVGSVKIYQTTSNSIIQLSYQNPLVLYNIKILAVNPQMNLTIRITESNGSQWETSFSSGTEISFKKVNYQSIVLSDPNDYTVFYTLQPVYADSYDELQQLEQESDIAITPINNVIITSPTDINGNVMVTVNKGYVVLTSSQDFIVPQGVYRINVLAIGGGGGGGGGYSSTYVGGGGASGNIVYGQIAVSPGMVLPVFVGAGGRGGTGGSSPTAGVTGGSSQINAPTGMYPLTNPYVIAADGGGGGGAASSTANGSPGTVTPLPDVMVGVQGLPFLLNYYGVAGNNGNGQTGGLTPVLAPGYNSVTSQGYGFNGAANAQSFGAGGNGGGVNANGQDGMNGIVIIWWGD